MDCNLAEAWAHVLKVEHHWL